MKRSTIISSGAVVLLGLAVFCILAGEIAFEVKRISIKAEARYHDNRTDSLVMLVDCNLCPLTDRNRAVWALGRLQEPRAIPVLRGHLTNRPCNHAHDLCQREIRKALELIEDRGTLHARFWTWAETRFPGR